MKKFFFKIVSFIENKFRDSYIEKKSREYNIDPKLIKAVLEVESVGIHRYNNRLIIRFENHIFRRLTGTSIKRIQRDKNDFLRQNEFYYYLNEAKKIDVEKAYRSISMGSVQIMGFNFHILDYSSAEEMFWFFTFSEFFALSAFFKFIIKNPSLYKACREKDFEKIAFYYNGKNFKKYNYDKKLKEAYKKFV